MYPMLMGEFEHVRDRIITVNGVLVHVPVRPGYAYVGIERGGEHGRNRQRQEREVATGG